MIATLSDAPLEKSMFRSKSAAKLTCPSTFTLRRAYQLLSQQFTGVLFSENCSKSSTGHACDVNISDELRGRPVDG